MRRPSCALLFTAVLAVSLGATSCGGGGSGGGSNELVLVGFNKPNVAGIALNEPLIFTFSAAIDPASITPDTLRVTGAIGPFFEQTVVDGNLVALLAQTPNFEDYSDAGYAAATTYSVDFAVFPAPSTITTPNGSPLLGAEGYQFTTVPTPLFVEPRRPFSHGLPPSAGGRSDTEGCLQNPDNSLYAGEIQFGSGPGARLLCLKNEGPPHVILDQCTPTHNDQSVGTPSAVTPGTINMPALRVRLNEPLDPLTVVPYVPTAKLGVNVQLWRVGDTDRVPIPPEPIRTNKPLIVQSLDQTEIIIVASNEDEFGNPVGGVPQGTYMINVTPAVTDLPGNPLVITDRPNPALGGYGPIDDTVNNSGVVPPGYRLFFVTLVVPGTAQSFNEGYNTNLNEYGDSLSGTNEPGVFEQTNTSTGDLHEAIPAADVPYPEYTLSFDALGVGQTTTANWNGGFRLFGMSGLVVNPDVAVQTGRLQAVFKPWVGTGGDGDFDSGDIGAAINLNTDPGPGASVNSDGIYEYNSFNLAASDTLTVSGSHPLVILCRGNVTIAGTIVLNGQNGGPGLDTDGTTVYTVAGAADAGGDGGTAAAGGGNGGAGGDPFQVKNASGIGSPGHARTPALGTDGTAGGSGGGFGQAPDQEGGGGGGYGAVGDSGSDADGNPAGNGGALIGTNKFGISLSVFAPDRTFSPNMDGSGGTGGGGGGCEDTNGNTTIENGDAGGGGGGGGGGGLIILANGTVTVSGSISCNGGAGGSTFAIADQSIDLGADDAPGGTGENADRVTGVNGGATPSGSGGPGGGGAGGGILLVGGTGVTLSATAVLTADGGAGGQSGDVDLVGGNGAQGKIAFGAKSGASVTVDASATVSPAQTAFEYKPTVDHVSAAMSHWYDLFTNTVIFDMPFWTDNFTDLGDDGLVLGVDYNVVLEFQGAANLSPLPVGGATPLTATGVTQWSANPNDVDGLRYVRYRWRFDCADDYPYTMSELPAILDFTIPFTR